MGTPKRIYLQAPPHPTSPYERTWCEDQIDETDTEYVLASALADPAPASKVLAVVEGYTSKFSLENAKRSDGAVVVRPLKYEDADIPVTCTVEAREEG